MLEAFNLLEPQIQKGIAALIHIMHGQPKTAQDYINEANALLAKRPAGT